MAPPTFASAAKRLPGNGVEVFSAKLTGGIQTCRNVLTAETDLAGSFQTFSSKLADAHKKCSRSIPPMTSGTGGEMVGLLKTWQALNELFGQTARAADELSFTLNAKACQQMNETTHSLQLLKQQLQLTKDSPGDQKQNLSARPNTAKGSSRRDVSPVSRELSRLRQRCQLAEDEVKASMESREQLKVRFGATLKPSLMEKAEERVTKAQDLHRKADKQLKLWNSKHENTTPAAQTASSPVSNGPSSARMGDSDSPSLTQTDLLMLEKAESNRLAKIRDSLKISAKALFDFHGVMGKSIAELMDTIDAFDPLSDHNAWLATVTGESIDTANSKQRKKLEPVVPRNERRHLRPTPAATPAAATHDEADKQFLLDTIAKKDAALSEANAKLERMTRKPRGRSRSSSGSSAGKLISRGRPGAVTSTAAAASEPSAVDDGNKKLTKSVSIVAPPSEPNKSLGGENGRLPREADKSMKVKKLFSRAWQSSGYDNEDRAQHSHRSPSAENSVAEVECLPEQAPPAAIAAKSSTSERSDATKTFEEFEGVKQDSPHSCDGAASRSVPASVVPDIEQILSYPMVPGIAPSQRLVEVQKRYEDFLLSLRDIDLSYNLRGELRWDDSMYNLNKCAELGAFAYPLKVPGGLPFSDPLTATEAPPYALEWGAKRLDEFQWRCIAYETLLLCHDTLNRVASVHQTIELPNRDIRLLSPDDYVNAVRPVPAMRKDYMFNQLVSRKRRQNVDQHLEGLKGVAATVDEGRLERAFAEGNLSLIRRLVLLCRVKLGIAGAVNSTIVHLLLGSGTEATEFGCWCSVHPLDIRYRVVKLLDSWIKAETNFNSEKRASVDKVVKDWVLRQLHVVHCAISFRLQRLQRFLPKRRMDWLHDWTDRGPWYRLPGASVIGSFSDNESTHFRGKPIRILKCIDESLAIIAGLTRAVDQGRWGEEFTSAQRDEIDRHRTRTGIIRLFRLMTNMDNLDRSMRAQVMADINRSSDPSTRGSPLEPSNASPQLSSNPDDYIPDEYKDENQVYAMLANEEQLIMSWPHEVPFLQLVLTFIWRTCFDAAAENKLNVDARTLAQGIIVCANQLQINHDIAKPFSQHADCRMPLMCMQTHSLLLAQAIWTETLTVPVADNLDSLLAIRDSPKAADFTRGLAITTLSPVKTKQRITVISEKAIETLHVLLESFPEWLVDREDEDGSDIESPGMDPETGDNLDRTLFHLRGARLRVILPETFDESLDTAADQSGLPGALADFQANDFTVANLKNLKEEVISPNSAYQAARQSCGVVAGGVAITRAGKTERVMQELLFLRLLCGKFFSDMQEILEDYRLRMEPSSLGHLVSAYDLLWAKMNCHGALPPAAPTVDINELNAHLPLPLLLKGPGPQHDCYRFFIFRSMQNLFNRVFADVLALLQQPVPATADVDSEEFFEECSQISAKFSDALKAYVDEIRCELEFFCGLWSPFLPDNQHAVIVIFSCRADLEKAIQTLTESPWWPDEDIPAGGTAMFSSIRVYELIEHEVFSVVTHPGLSEQPTLLEPFAALITAALAKRFKSVEAIIERCMLTESWVPQDPPTTPQSVGIVDVFSFINHVFDVIQELRAPMDWVLPAFLQFLGRVTQEYTQFVKSSSAEPSLIAIRDKAEAIFVNLHKPITRSSGFGAGFGKVGGKREKRNKGGGVLKNWAFGTKKGTTSKRSKLPSEVIDGELDIAIEEEASENEPKSQTGSEVSGRSRPMTVKMHMKKKNRGPDLTAEEEDLIDRIGTDMTLKLRDLQFAFADDPLVHWLVRLHNLVFFSSELPGLAAKFSAMAKQDRFLRDERHNEIQRGLSAGQTRSRHVKRNKFDDHSSHSVKQIEKEEFFSRMDDLLKEVVTQCQQRVKECAHSICRFISLRLIYRELGPDLFEDLYQPEFSSSNVTLEHIISSLYQTMGRFVSQCPDSMSLTLNTHLLADLVKAWALLLTEMGYAGHVFSESDLSLLDEDLEALRDYAATNCIPTQVEMIKTTKEKDKEKDKEKSQQAKDAKKVVDLFDYVNDFFVLIASKPETLAALGGNHTTSKPTKPKPATEGGGADMIFDTPPPAFDDAMIGEMTGESKPKRKKKGLAKFIKF